MTRVCCGLPPAGLAFYVIKTALSYPGRLWSQPHLPQLIRSPKMAGEIFG
jgi:hypothetical protein